MQQRLFTKNLQIVRNVLELDSLARSSNHWLPIVLPGVSWGYATLKLLLPKASPSAVLACGLQVVASPHIIIINQALRTTSTCSPNLSDAMANKSGREALQGAEVHTLDLIFEALTSAQLAELLKPPLERAAAKGNRDLARRLVKAGAQIGTALHKASGSGHGEIVSDLLESGASVAAKNTLGRTPLHLAARYGKTETVQLLLLKGADIDAFDNGEMTPLFVAALFDHLGAALALLAAGADVCLKCGTYKSPVVQVAAQQGSVDIVRAVIEHGADVNAADTHQQSALHLATRCNKAGAIDVLVEAGANIEARTVSGFTPLHAACFHLNLEALLCLLKHGATVNAQDDTLLTPLTDAAAKAGTQGAAEVVDALLRAGADETIIIDGGLKAADVIGAAVEEEEDRLAEDVERVRELLANAPADRAWRRRGYLVLCRAHPDRVQHQGQVSSGIHHSDTARRTRTRAKLARPAETAGDSSSVDECTGVDWVDVVSKVLVVQEEGIFRTIVGYL